MCEHSLDPVLQALCSAIPNSAWQMNKASNTEAISFCRDCKRLAAWYSSNNQVNLLHWEARFQSYWNLGVWNPSNVYVPSGRGMQASEEVLTSFIFLLDSKENGRYTLWYNRLSTAVRRAWRGRSKTPRDHQKSWFQQLDKPANGSSGLCLNVL